MIPATTPLPEGRGEELHPVMPKSTSRKISAKGERLWAWLGRWRL
jgi:hypothetical protein